MKNTKRDDKYVGFGDYLKEKFIEIVTDYIKRNTRVLQKDLTNFTQKIIEKKVKKEVKKYAYLGISFGLFAIASLAILYGIISMFISIGELPSYLSPLIFGLITLIIAVFIYLLR